MFLAVLVLTFVVGFPDALLALPHTLPRLILHALLLVVPIVRLFLDAAVCPHCLVSLGPMLVGIAYFLAPTAVEVCVPRSGVVKGAVLTVYLTQHL